MTSADLQALQQRNALVDENKAWETSWTRRLLIALMIYAVAGVYLSLLDAALPWLSALVPAGGYIFSTLSLPLAKTVWLEKVYRK